MKKMKRLYHVLLASLFFLSCGLNPAFSQTWPPSIFPVIPEIPASLPAPANPEWVNCDMYNYTDAGQDYYLLAFAYDDLTSSKVYYGVYDSKTLVTIWDVINDAQHPDIVLGDKTSTYCMPPGSNITCLMEIVYEDLNNNRCVASTIEVNDAGTALFTLVATPCGGFWGPLNSKNPHIDLAPVIGSIGVSMHIITYQVNKGNGDEIHAFIHNINEVCVSSPTWTNCYDLFVDYGIRPDVAAVVESNNGLLLGHFVYYKDDFSEIKHADLSYDGSTNAYTLGTYPPMETATFLGYPRIDGPNIYDAANTPWHALAELIDETTPIPQIHGYNDIGGINIIQYSNGYSPTVTVANGAATSGSPADVGNDGYAVGWNIPQFDFEALYLDEANSNTVVAGYSQVNYTPFSIFSYGSGKNLCALTSSTNTGKDLAGAWFDGSNIKIKLATNSFAFKPTTIQLTSGKPGSIIYPNPATDRLWVRETKATQYAITDITGRHILSGQLGNAGINISSLPKGMYLINLDGQGMQKTERFTKE